MPTHRQNSQGVRQEVCSLGGKLMFLNCLTVLLSVPPAQRYPTVPTLQQCVRTCAPHYDNEKLLHLDILANDHPLPPLATSHCYTPGK
jgi:hypothetical protein